MAIITDVKKLRPELLEMSVSELERRRAEIDMAIADKRREEEVKAKEAMAVTANDHIESIIAGVKFLHENGILPERVAQAFSRGDGMFVPAMMLRTITAESLVAKPSKPEGKKRIRRTKAEIEALKAAGGYKPRRGGK